MGTLQGILDGITNNYPKIIYDERTAITFLFNIFSFVTRPINNYLEKKRHSYQLHESLRTLFLLVRQAVQYVPGITEQEIYTNFFNLDIILGKGQYGIVFHGSFLNENGFAVKSQPDSNLEFVKIEKTDVFRYQKLVRFTTVKQEYNKKLLKEYLINRYLNLFDIPIFQQTYTFINCSRPIYNDMDVISFCTVDEPGVIISQKINGPLLTEWVKKATRDDILIVLIILLYNLDMIHSKTGFTHYDLHTGNVIVETYPDKFSFRIADKYVSSRFVPKIIDFGLARIEIGGTVFHHQGLESVGITSEPNIMYDVYKLIMFLLVYNDSNIFLATPFFGRPVTREYIIDLQNSKKRPFVNGDGKQKYKDRYFAPPDNFSLTIDEYLHFFYERPEVKRLLGGNRTHPEYGLDETDFYKLLNIDCDKYIFPVENLYQKYIFELGSGPKYQEILTLRIDTEGKYFYQREFYEYLEQVNSFSRAVEYTNRFIQEALRKDKYLTEIEDPLYGSHNAKTIYRLIASIIQHYSMLMFAKKVLRKTKTIFSVESEVYPNIIRLGDIKKYRNAPQTRDLFDALGNIDDFDPKI